MGPTTILSPILLHNPVVPQTNHTLRTFLRYPAEIRQCYMALETFCWRSPTFVLLRLPLSHTEVSSVSLAFTEGVRYNASLPLPLLL